MNVKKNINAYNNYKGGFLSCTGQIADRSDAFDLLVGMGFDSKLNATFWKLKSSKGKNWGESGFYRIQKGTCLDVGKIQTYFTQDPA